MARDRQLLSAARRFRCALKELLQLDSAELELGVYRVLALRRARVEAALDEERLASLLESSLARGGSLTQDQEELGALADEVLSALTRFFSGYYGERGELLARPRARAGEDVQLRWASEEQHYIKTGEWHADYTARPGGEAPRLRFRLAVAEADRDNNKSSERRRYLLRAEQPVELAGDTLTAWFEFRVPRPGAGRQPSQRSLCAAAESRILAAAPARWRDALARPAPQRPGSCTALGYELLRYTQRRTRDYLIHKRLGAFLREELDDFLKRELLSLDGLDRAGLDRALRRLHAARGVGERIIDALARVERLHRRLFLKRKLVLRSDWIIPVTALPAERRARVLEQPAIRRALTEQLAVADERSAPAPGQRGETVFTGPLPAAEVQRLVLAIEELDARRNGLVLRGENLQALRLLAARYRGSCELVYIDPPYNTGGDGFVYRDAYRPSSWLSMMAERLAAGRALQPRDGLLVLSIDDAELHHAKQLLKMVYGPELATLVWDRNRKNDARYFSVGHEYMLVHARDGAALAESGARFREPKPGVDEARAVFRRLTRDHEGDWEAIRRGWLAWFDGIPVSDPRRRMRRYTRVGPRGPFRDDGNINWPGGGGPRYEVLHPKTGKPCKLPRSGWRYPTPARFWEEVAIGRIVFGPDHATVPRVASYLFEGKGQVMPSVFYSYAQTAAREFEAMFGGRVFDNPKPWRDLARLFRYLGDRRATVLDYFAGSGSTGHAVLALNREDGGERGFVLVEMGAHGDSVLIPRLQKAAMGDIWSEGKLVRVEPTHLLCQVLQLESHDDALENLETAAARESSPGALRYVLEPETDDPQLDRALFRAPWGCTIKARREGVLRDTPVDLVETFNLLIGLRARRYDELGREGALLVRGEDEDGRRALVLWRDVDKCPNSHVEDALRDVLDEERARPEARRAARLFVNGGPPRGGLQRAGDSWTLESIEDEFCARMFDVADPGSG